jgi:hypothetical protein
MSSIEFLRQFRLGEYAIFDFAVSFLGIFLLSPLLSRLFLKLGIKIPKINWLFLTLPLSILVHWLTGRMTPMTINFINLHDFYFLKVVIIGLTILGLRGIKFIRKNKIAKNN